MLCSNNPSHDSYQRWLLILHSSLLYLTPPGRILCIATPGSQTPETGWRLPSSLQWQNPSEYQPWSQGWIFHWALTFCRFSALAWWCLLCESKDQYWGRYSPHSTLQSLGSGIIRLSQDVIVIITRGQQELCPELFPPVQVDQEAEVGGDVG